MIGRLWAKRRFMREHRWTHAHLSAYLDDELAAGERARVDGHVRLCPECRRVLRTLRRTIQELMQLRPKPSESIADGVIDRLRTEA